MTLREELLESLSNESYISSINDVVFSVLCLLFSVYMFFKAIKKLNSRHTGLYWVVIFHHFFITFIYLYLVKNLLIASDARVYYLDILNEGFVTGFSASLSPGASFILYLNSFLVDVLGLNFTSCYIVFSCIGLLGLVKFIELCSYLGLRASTKYFGIYIFPFFLILPNVHFWTVSLGKDSLMFFAIMLLSSSLINNKIRFLSFALGFGICFMIRPHIALVVILSLFIVLLINTKVSILLKYIFVPVVGLFCLIFLYIFLIKDLGYSSLDLNHILRMLDSRQGFYSSSNNAVVVDLVGLPLIFKMFFYLFGPLGYSSSPFFLFSVIENYISLFLILFIFKFSFFRFVINSELLIQFCVVYAFIGIAVMGYIFSSYGVSLRQKTMFIYNLYLVVFAFIVYLRNRRYQRSIRLG